MQQHNLVILEREGTDAKGQPTMTWMLVVDGTDIAIPGLIDYAPHIGTQGRYVELRVAFPCCQIVNAADDPRVVVAAPGDVPPVQSKSRILTP